MSLLVVCLASLASGQEIAVTISADNVPALVLSVPKDARVSPSKEKTVIQTTNMFLHVWPVPGAKTVADAAARVGEVIKGDVLKFAATKTNDLTLAGAPARHLIGNGAEADDGDPSTADVVIFTVGNHAFVACVHGEGNDASCEREPMLAVLRTAKSP